MEYTDRAFQQDSNTAMGGNIVRGLIELTTNSDDAYARLTPVGKGRARILVEVEHKRNRDWRVIVRDRATGMTKVELYDGLIRLGGRTSGYERGQNVRRNRGRGAKDLVACGPVQFETIRNDRFACLRVTPDQKYELYERPATSTDRERIGATRGNGTMVTVEVSKGHR